MIISMNRRWFLLSLPLVPIAAKALVKVPYGGPTYTARGATLDAYFAGFKPGYHIVFPDGTYTAHQLAAEITRQGGEWVAATTTCVDGKTMVGLGPGLNTKLQEPPTVLTINGLTVNR